MRARGLVIVDERGVERVVIGAPAPDPQGGKRVGPLYGLVLNGPTGEERGGYGVMGPSNEGILTLDGATGDEVFKVVANPDAGASLFVIHQQGAAVALTTYRSEPEVHLLSADSSRRARTACSFISIDPIGRGKPKLGIEGSEVSV